jgi:hypothetical protein
MLLLGGELLVPARLALEALGLLAVLLGARQPLLGRVGALTGAQRAGLVLLAVAFGLAREPCAGALALDPAAGRCAVGQEGDRGDDDDGDDDDHDGHMRAIPASGDRRMRW